MIGIMVSSFVGRPLIPVLGRRLVVIGLVATLAGVVGLWITITGQGTAVSVWLLAPSLFVMGMGMGTCFFTIFDFAIGDVAQDEAGSASGSLSAVQQLASALGSAVVTTIYFAQRTAHGAGSAMTTSLVVVTAITWPAWASCGCSRSRPPRAPTRSSGPDVEVTDGLCSA